MRKSSKMLILLKKLDNKVKKSLQKSFLCKFLELFRVKNYKGNYVENE